jgi:hypothetical protein
MERQLMGFIEQTLTMMNVESIQMDEETDVLFDFNLNSIRLDFLFSSLEKQYQLNTPLIFNSETATLGELAFCINSQSSDN